jgi:hypothetical protein
MTLGRCFVVSTFPLCYSAIHFNETSQFERFSSMVGLPHYYGSVVRQDIMVTGRPDGAELPSHGRERGQG